MLSVLLTGAAGRVGLHTLRFLLARQCRVTAIDLVPLPRDFRDTLAPAAAANLLSFYCCDLTDYKALEAVLDNASPRINAVVHLGSIPDPTRHDVRAVHNMNVSGSYNIMQTAAQYGIKRIVQASSVNATGLSYSPPGHHRFDSIPVREDAPRRPEDAYALSKAVCELQADATCRFYHPNVRIASLRFHFCAIDYAYAVEHHHPRDAFSWTSYDACAFACLLGLTSEGWEGHEVFNIVADDICWEGPADALQRATVATRQSASTLELMRRYWGGRFGLVDEGYWKGHPRRALWDNTKAKKMLGWAHDEIAASEGQADGYA